jgi:hypothetical protein
MLAGERTSGDETGAISQAFGMHEDGFGHQ